MSSPVAALPTVHVAPAVLAAAVAAAESARPHEFVGLLGGRRRGEHWQVQRLAPLAAATNPHGFAVEAVELVGVAERWAAEGVATIGLVHSHPHGAPHLSRRDVAHAWPELLQLVLGGTFAPSHCKAFVVRDGVAHPVVLRLPCGGHEA